MWADLLCIDLNHLQFVWKCCSSVCSKDDCHYSHVVGACQILLPHSIWRTMESHLLHRSDVIEHRTQPQRLEVLLLSFFKCGQIASIYFNNFFTKFLILPSTRNKAKFKNKTDEMLAYMEHFKMRRRGRKSTLGVWKRGKSASSISGDFEGRKFGLKVGEGSNKNQKIVQQETRAEWIDRCAGEQWIVLLF